MEAEKAVGIPIARDQANGDAIGSYWTPNSLDPVERTRSYAKSYNEIAKSRPNYHLLTGRTVTKINIKHGKAMGVEVRRPPILACLNSS
jgi:choline dehydrogenase-like flavoprotein